MFNFLWNWQFSKVLYHVKFSLVLYESISCPILLLKFDIISLFFNVNIQIGVKWYLIMTLICLFVMTSDEHIFLGLLIIHFDLWSTIEYFAHFYWVVILLLSWKASYYNMNISSLPNIYAFQNILLFNAFKNFL